MNFALKLSLTRKIIEMPVKTKEKEAELIEACLAKKRWAQKELYERFYGKMMGVCLRYAKDENDAKDILNEGFIKVFRYLGSYKVGTSLDSWVRRIMVNTSIDHYRKMVRTRTEDIEHASHIESNCDDAISSYAAKEILAVVQKLPHSYRSVFNLYAIEGYSHREISNMLGITESTSRSNLVKARKRLKALLSHLYKK